MKAIVTGASSGIGAEIAKELLRSGYTTVLVGRNENSLKDISNISTENAIVEPLDLINKHSNYLLFEKHKDASLLVNCAGVGVFGEFDKTSLDDELDMLSVNVVSLHILTKLFYSEFTKRGEGRILNVASSASFFTGPLYSSYYASKAYVYRFTRAIAKENKKHSNNVVISVFCPGPVKTNFGKRLGIANGKGAISPELASKKALEGLFKNKELIFPNLSTALLVCFSRLLPERVLSDIVYCHQLKKLTKTSLPLVKK